MDLEWKETEMEALNLADNALKGLKPDPAWDVSGVRRHGRRRDRRRARIVRGRDHHRLRQPHPGLVSNNQMERAFSWKRLLAAMLVPFVIGAAVSGWGWSCNVFGSNGLGVNRSYTQASGSGKTNLKDGRGKGDDSLTGLVKQLGDDIVSGISDTVKTTVKGAVDDALKGWNWVSGGDGKGNIFQKAGNALGDAGKWVTGADGKGNVFQKAGEGHQGRFHRSVELGVGQRQIIPRPIIGMDGPHAGVVFAERSVNHVSPFSGAHRRNNRVRGHRPAGQ